MQKMHINAIFCLVLLCAARYLASGRYKSGGFAFKPVDNNDPVPIVRHFNITTRKYSGVGVPCRAMDKVTAEFQRFCTSIVDPENPAWYLIQRSGHFFFEPEFAATYPDTFDQDASFLLKDGFFPGFSTLESVSQPNHYFTAGLDDLAHLREFEDTKEFKNAASQYIIEHHTKGESTLIVIISFQRHAIRLRVN